MATSIKISQLPAKGSALEATDLLEVSEFNGTGYISKSITGQEIIDSVPSSVTAWGTITGTLSSQTDLNTALSGKVPTTRTLTINGTTQDLSADRTFTISTGITIGTTAITSGTVGRVLFQGTGNVVSQSTNLFWDNTNGRLGIGTSTPSTALMMQQDGASFIRMVRNLSTTEFGMFITNVRLGLGSAGGVFSSNNYEFRDSAGTSAFLTINGGNVLINTTTDAGFKLDVNGTARVQGNAQFGTGFYWDNTNGRLGIGTSTPTQALDISGNINALNSSNSSLELLTLRNSSTGTANQTRIRFFNDSGATPGTNGGMIFLTGNNFSGFPTNSFGFWNESANGVIALATNNTERFRITSGGNVLINATTDAGYKLDVNGISIMRGILEIQSTNGLRLRSTSGNASISFRPTGNDAEIKTNDGSVNCIYLNQNGIVGFSQQVGFGNTTISSASAQVAIDSTTKGFLPPRMTTTQKNAIATPATGLMVYDTTLNLISVYNGTIWISL
jgi:hypothetical protein